MILVTGASGRIGQRVAELLHVRGAELRLTSRKPAGAPALGGVDVVHDDFEQPQSLLQPFGGIDTALVISGMAPPGARALTHRNAFEAAARAGVRHIVYVALRGASATSPFPYNRDHFEGERFLAATGVANTCLRVGFYTDMFLSMIDPQVVLRGPAAAACRGAFISREDVAQAAMHPPGGAPEISGPEMLTFADVATGFSATSGTMVRFVEECRDAFRTHLDGSGLPPWVQELKIGWGDAVAAAAAEQAPAD